MKKWLSLATIVFLFSSVFSQNFELKSIELGFKAGLSNYQGDLVKESINIGETHLALGAFARAFVHDNIAIGVGLNTLKITGNDRNYTLQEDAGRYNRAYKMENRLFEGSLRGYFFPFFGESPVYDAWVNFQPYVGLGLSVVLNDPDFVDQNPNDGITRGEKESPAISVPIIFGLKYVIKPQVSVSAESVFNVAFTDNLDGYTFLENNDWFMFHSISISWHYIQTTRYNSTREKKKTYYKKKKRRQL